MRRKTDGFSMVELMVAVAVLGIALAVALPNFTETIRRNRMVGVAETLLADIQYARSEAVKQNQPMSIDFTIEDDGDWCYGLDQGSDGCDCTETDKTAADVCAITRNVDGDAELQRIVSSSDHANVSLVKTGLLSRVTLSEVDGQVIGNSTLTLGAADRELGVVISTFGRVRMCSPSGEKKLAGYEDC